MQKIDVDCLYVNGDSWCYGSELIDPDRPDITDHFNEVHVRYRESNYWPKLLADSLGIELFNGSQAGAGNDRILRTSIFDLSELQMQGRKPLAIIAWSQLQRFELSNTGGHTFRSFVGPAESDVPKCVKDIWAGWSSDHCDVVKWLTQIISLHSFCRVNNVPLIGFNVFRTMYMLLEKYIHTTEFKPYLYQLNNTCILASQQYQFSFESILKQRLKVEYGPGGHPLKAGQQILAKHIEKIIRQQFTIN